MSGPVESVTPIEASRLRDAVLVDVREADEFAAGHAPQAIHVALGDLEANVDRLAPSRTIVCVCRSGNRSMLAAQYLAANGRDARNLDGGMRAWAAAALEIVDANGQPGTVI